MNDGIGGTDSVQTRHHEYAGRYEMIRKLIASENVPLLAGQAALILCDLLEEMAQVRSDLQLLCDELRERRLTGK